MTEPVNFHHPSSFPESGPISFPKDYYTILSTAGASASPPDTLMTTAPGSSLKELSSALKSVTGQGFLYAGLALGTVGLGLGLVFENIGFFAGHGIGKALGNADKGSSIGLALGALPMIIPRIIFAAISYAGMFILSPSEKEMAIQESIINIPLFDIAIIRERLDDMDD